LRIPASVSLDDLIMLVFHSSKNDRINGRTAIQKLVYFSTSYLGIPTDFIPHYFGPYSALVDSTLGQLVSMGLVEERAFLTDNGRKMYQYVITSDGLVYAKKLFKKYRTKVKTIKKITEAFENIGGDRINRLACAAKVHYLAKGNRFLDINTVITEAGSHGWLLNESEIVRAADTIKNLASR
jgi:uncharacterized protein YwgA